MNIDTEFFPSKQTPLKEKDFLANQNVEMKSLPDATSAAYHILFGDKPQPIFSTIRIIQPGVESRRHNRFQNNE